MTVFSVVLIACALGVVVCFAFFMRAAHQEQPYATPRTVYAWLGAALALFWAQVVVVVLWLTGMVGA